MTFIHFSAHIFGGAYKNVANAIILVTLSRNGIKISSSPPPPPLHVPCHLIMFARP